MCMYIHIYMYIYVYADTYLYIYIYTYVYAYIHIRAHTHTHTHARTYIYAHIHASKRVTLLLIYWEYHHKAANPAIFLSLYAIKRQRSSCEHTLAARIESRILHERIALSGSWMHRHATILARKHPIPGLGNGDAGVSSSCLYVLSKIHRPVKDS